MLQAPQCLQKETLRNSKPHFTYVNSVQSAKMQSRDMSELKLGLYDLQVVQAAQTAIIGIAPWLDCSTITSELLPDFDRLMLCPEHEIRSAVVQLYAHLGTAIKDLQGSGATILEVLLPRILEQAEDMDFQVRRVRILAETVNLHNTWQVYISSQQKPKQSKTC